MVTYVLLDVGVGGLILIFGGAALLIFAVLAFLIIRFSIRIIVREIRGEKEPANPEIERELKESGESRTGSIFLSDETKNE